MATYTIQLSDTQLDLLRKARVREAEFQQFIDDNADALSDPGHADFSRAFTQYSTLLKRAETNFAAFGRVCSDEIEL